MIRVDPHLLDSIADAVNPLLALTAVTFAFARKRKAREVLPPRRFLAGVLLGLTVVYLLQNLDSRLHFCSRLGLDYSTHSAFAVSVVTSLVLANARWLFALVPVLLGYGWLMAHLGYHTVADMLAAAAVLVPATWALHRLLRATPPAPADGARALDLTHDT